MRPATRGSPMRSANARGGRTRAVTNWGCRSARISGTAHNGLTVRGPSAIGWTIRPAMKATSSSSNAANTGQAPCTGMSPSSNISTRTGRSSHPNAARHWPDDRCPARSAGRMPRLCSTSTINGLSPATSTRWQDGAGRRTACRRTVGGVGWHADGIPSSRPCRPFLSSGKYETTPSGSLRR